MKKQDQLSILITAIMGFFAGVFMFFSYANSIPVPVVGTDVQTQAETQAFSIIAEVYGACAEDCPSFQLLEDGSYRYRFVMERGQPAIIKDGTLPLVQQSAIKRSLSTEALMAQSELENRETCASQTDDGLDFRYEITFESETYVLDSCTTVIDDQSDLWLALTGTWNYLQTTSE